VNLDLREGEPRRAEDLAGSGGAGGGGASGSDWPRWTLFAVSAVLSGLALWTDWAWLTLLALGALLAGLTFNAWGPGRVRPRRTGGTRASGLTLHARRADVALLAWRSRLSHPVHTGRSRRSGRPRRADWSRLPFDGLSHPGRARLRHEESHGEGDGAE
jgi:hypothetical protein